MAKVRPPGGLNQRRRQRWVLHAQTDGPIDRANAGEAVGHARQWVPTCDGRHRANRPGFVEWGLSRLEEAKGTCM